jgi:hypothetical protein
VVRLEAPHGCEVDILRYQPLKSLIKTRWLQPLLLLVSFAVFTVLVFAGHYGTPVGSRNAALIFVWIMWFFLLVTLLIPLGGRIWCFVCPIPAPTDWLLRRSFIFKNNNQYIPPLRWPRSLENTLPQMIVFLVAAAMSPIILFYPMATSLALVSLVFLSIAIGLLFKSKGKTGRIFCRFICPVGGFIKVYAPLGGLKVRSKNRDFCNKCTRKTCITGNSKGYGCPWYIYPGGLRNNSDCGLCMECIKTCSYDNMTIKVGSMDKFPTEKSMDQAVLSIVLLGSALFYSVVFFGWFSWLKDLSNFINGPTISYSLSLERVVGFSILLLASVFLAALVYLFFIFLSKGLTRVNESTDVLFKGYSPALVPLGLAAWVGFMVYEVMVNGAYIAPILSDPWDWDWGWDIFGTADYPWRFYLPSLMPYILIAIFLGGNALTTKVAWDISVDKYGDPVKAALATIPMAFFAFIVTSGLILLYTAA